LTLLQNQKRGDEDQKKNGQQFFHRSAFGFAVKNVKVPLKTEKVN
jgi:hypothetical protein